MNLRVGIDIPFLAAASDVRDYVTAVEHAGYNFVGFSEHVCSTVDTIFPAPMFTFDEPWRETISFGGFVAGVSRTIEINPAMMLLPLYHPVLAAKQVAELANLSDGRLRVAVSMGWNPRETESLGVDPTTRGARFEEQITVLRRLWTERAVDHQGRFFELRATGISPRPVRQIPLWMGAGHVGASTFPGPVAIRRAAQLADGFKFLAPSFLDRDQVARTTDELRRRVASEGRDPDAFGIEVRMPVQLTTPGEWRTIVSWAKAIGATHFGVSNRIAGGTVADQITAAQQFVDATRDAW